MEQEYAFSERRAYRLVPLAVSSRRSQPRRSDVGECLALEVDASFASRRVTRVLEGIIAECGIPQVIWCDNGPAFCGLGEFQRPSR
jgi:hypothetical protein